MNLHDFFVAPFTYGFMQRGALSAVLLSLSGGLLGCILVLRRMALMGDALSHSLLPGIAIAWLLCGPSSAALFVGALLAGLFTALGSAFLSRVTRVKEDASFGSLFIVLFGAGIALISKLPTQVNLAHFLFGDILGVSPAGLRFTAAISGATVALFALFHRGILLETFDPIFFRATGGRGGIVHAGFLALTVLNLVAAMQTMGTVLLLGLFLLPAVSAYLWCDHFGRMLALSVGIAVAGSLAGLLLSFHAGFSSGAAIVLCLGAVFFVSVIASPRYGLASRLAGSLRRRRTSSTTAAMAFAAFIVMTASPPLGAEEPPPLHIVTLHPILTEIAAAVGGDRVEVKGLLPAGADPHTFEAAPSDMRLLSTADLVLASGLNLESYLDRLAAGSGDVRRVIAVGDALPLLLTAQGRPAVRRWRAPDANPEAGEAIDPHWWHSIDNVLFAADMIRAECARRRPGWAGEFAGRAQAYEERLFALKAWVSRELGHLPEERRRLVSLHEGFGYFAHDYGFSVFALGGLSTESEPDARRLARLIDTVRRERIGAVFAENDENPALIQDLLRETGARLGGILFADGLGPPGSDASTYETMYRHNVRTLVGALAAAR